jgi:flagellar P-ring protein FlgI
MESMKKLLASLLIWCLLTITADAATLLKHIARLKGQEENTIQGIGLVVGLNGTGDGGGFGPMAKSLAAMLEKLNNPAQPGTPVVDPKAPLAELKDAKNVALVMVTVTIPASGARQGDQLECVVSSIGAAKSLENGYLLSTPLLAPQYGVGSDRVYGIAQGALQLDNARAKTVARVRQGCRLEEDFRNEFIKSNKITLVLNKSHADFNVAQEVAERINTEVLLQSKQKQEFNSVPNHSFNQEKNKVLAIARDQVNIEVEIPAFYLDDPVQFVAQVMEIELIDPQTGGKVIINERTGTIVISGDVEIGSVAVTHRNLVIETPGATPVGSRFVGVESARKPSAKLKSMVESLNALKVPVEDQIAIIKGIERDGKLHGTLIIE